MYKVKRCPLLKMNGGDVDCAQMVEIRPFFDAEMNKGKPSGPQFVKDWPADRDPRFCEPPNPLYDPSACRDTDWRNKLDVVLYLRFADYVAQTRGRQYRHVLESMEEENIFNVRNSSVTIHYSWWLIYLARMIDVLFRLSVYVMRYCEHGSTHLITIFRDNQGKLVPECLHSGFYRS